MNKNYKLVIPFFAVALFLLASFSGASALITNVDVEFNGIDLTSDVAVAYASSNNAVLVRFVATDNATDVEIEAEIPGYDVSEKVFVGNTVQGRTYSKVLNLDLSSELDDEHREGKLYITISDEDGELFHKDYSIEKQRESYEISVDDAIYSTKVSAGDIVPVKVVLVNTGYNDLKSSYVSVSIPALGISTREYFGHLYATEGVDRDEEDTTAEKTVYLQIPSDAETGVYELVVEAYNDDTETVQKSVIAVEGVTSSDDSKTLSQDDNGNSNSIIALTIVLAVVFVALLVVLIVLITKKDKTFEEVETSYY